MGEELPVTSSCTLVNNLEGTVTDLFAIFKTRTGSAPGFVEVRIVTLSEERKLFKNTKTKSSKAKQKLHSCNFYKLCDPGNT